ncbi:hypothetical protein [Methylorubrum sp. SL192]|uniref:hypothetical protein n=1 Tax=Methylorubrum sp. SL192 TaxID=2995167 RepID=UPI002275EA12|nr:hypothetical protein [Methylorubrum sp. SL192]MCY1645005.1 hypothetical protein [Methylorubrum sp. SL192]
MLFCTPAPGLSHAGILAWCTLTALRDDELHDLLGGHVPVETTPEPTYLELTAEEQARGWLQRAEQRVLEIKRRGGTSAEIVSARQQVDLAHLRVTFARAVEAVGPLDADRTLEFDWNDYSRYEVRDEDDGVLFHVPRTLRPQDIHWALAIHDRAFFQGLAKGREQVRRPILTALGLIDGE